MDTKLHLDKLVESSESNGKSNYTAWRFKLDLLLRMKKIYDIATGAKAKPAVTDNKYGE